MDNKSAFYKTLTAKTIKKWKHFFKWKKVFFATPDKSRCNLTRPDTLGHLQA